ncbi:MAG: TOMM precursor leader peptide-binding protein [Myxococcota bacterium]|nr:TOMM precursor leader peptide-binding protein [Myxococcota bacterium]
MDSDSVFLIGERQRFILSDVHTAAVASLVDGKRSVQEIMGGATSLRVSESVTLYILSQLVAQGHVVPASPEILRETAAFWDGVGVDARLATATLGRVAVAVRCIGEPTSARQMAEEALHQAGVRIDSEATIQVVVTDDYLRSELAPINSSMLHQDAPWAILKVVGTKPLVGPVFLPHRGPCWECLAFWMRNNRPVEELVRRHHAHEHPISPPNASIEASLRAACGFGALAIARALACLDLASGVPFDSQVLELDLASFRTTSHAIVKRPQCPACGDSRLMRVVGQRPIELRPIEKTHTTDGGHRQRTPRETYARYQHLISPITGPVTHVVPVPGRDTELRAVYASGYLVCPRGDVPRTNVFDKVCAGKGRSAEQARVSALCEALERYSGVYRGDEARVRATTQELGIAAVPVADLLNFSDAQYHERARINRHGTNRRERVPEPLDSTTAIDWTPAWSLTRNERRYVPLAYCYSEAPTEYGTSYCDPCGNGAAAGNCIEEAILHGLLELVERDAVSMWWYNRVCRPAVDVGSFRDGYFDALRADYARLGWETWVLDLTHDLRIPTCVTLAHHAKTDRFAIGFGCHLEPHLAVQRALTEMNQLFEPGGERRAPWDADVLSDREYLFPHPNLPPVTAEHLPRAGPTDLRGDIDQCRVRLERAGLELIAVDKTRPDIDLSVVQVIVPGLRHFWPRFGPGRLYVVPFELGWIPSPLVETNLNQVPLFV